MVDNVNVYERSCVYQIYLYMLLPCILRPHLQDKRNPCELYSHPKYSNNQTAKHPSIHMCIFHTNNPCRHIFHHSNNVLPATFLLIFRHVHIHHQIYNFVPSSQRLMDRMDRLHLLILFQNLCYFQHRSAQL